MTPQRFRPSPKFSSNLTPKTTKIHNGTNLEQTAESPRMKLALAQSNQEREICQPGKRRKSSVQPSLMVNSKLKARRNSSTPEVAEGTTTQQVESSHPQTLSTTMLTSRPFVDSTDASLDRGRARKDMEALYSLVKDLAVGLLDDFNCAAVSQLQAPAQMVRSGSRRSPLYSLYRKLFGERIARAKKAHLDHTSTLNSVIGLIGAFMVIKVFETCPGLKIPEEICEFVRDAVGRPAMFDHIAREFKGMGQCSCKK